MDNNEIKKKILIKAFKILLPLTSNEIYTNSTTSTTTNTLINCEKQEKEKIIFNIPPSLFMVKFVFMKIFKENKAKKNEINNFKVNIYYVSKVHLHFFKKKYIFNYFLLILIGI